MTAEAVIAEIEALPANERAKVFAFVGGAMEDVQAGRLIDPEIVLKGGSPPPRA